MSNGAGSIYAFHDASVPRLAGASTRMVPDKLVLATANSFSAVSLDMLGLIVEDSPSF